MIINIEALRELVTFTYKKPIMQTIMDACYDQWEENKDWKYKDMLAYAHIKYGKVAKFLVMAGNYNCQVCNGGHQQYFDNGYASNGGGCFQEHDISCNLAIELLHCIKEFNLINTPSGKTISKILSEFIDTVPEYVDDTEEEYEDIFDNLDDEYYKANDIWLNFLEFWITKWLEKGHNPLKG